MNKSVTLTIFLVFQLLFSLRHVVSQNSPFVLRNATLPDLGFSAAAWGDYDGDGDLDLAMNGTLAMIPVTRILQNDSGWFTTLPANLFGLHQGSVNWADYDLDGDLDLVVTGMDTGGLPYTHLIRNDSGTFAETGISLPGMSDGTATWGDYNNDGLPDLLIAGNLMSAIYRNAGDSGFININAQLPAVQSPMAAWCDYNNDGWSDLMICGDTGGGFISSLFRNDEGTFHEVTVSPEPFMGLYSGGLRWSDLDLDGDQDLVISGMDLYIDAYLLAYRNDGNDHFTRFTFQEGNFLGGALDLGDYNADGLPDLVVMGRTPGCGGTASTLLFENQGYMNFFPVSTLIPGYKQGAVLWGDYNNDGFSDLLFTGMDGFDNERTSLYLNTLGDTLFRPNTPPSAPENPGVIISGSETLLVWDRATDAVTPSSSLTYNLMIGTSPELANILSPLSDPVTGLRLVAADGNVSGDTSWPVRGLTPGTYYFRVQAVDNGFLGGAFSVTGMFTYVPVGMGTPFPHEIRVFPNPSKDFVTIQLPLEFQDGTVTISDLSGRQVYQQPWSGLMDIRSIPSGFYLVTVASGQRVWTQKWVRE